MLHLVLRREARVKIKRLPGWSLTKANLLTVMDNLKKTRKIIKLKKLQRERINDVRRIQR